MAWTAVQVNTYLKVGAKVTTREVNTRLPAEERRAQLVRAALTLAEDEGFGSVTIRRVADTAGVSLGVVHYCFENKEELMGAAITNVVATLGEAMQAVYAQSAEEVAHVQGVAGLRDMIHTGLSAMWALIEATPNVQLLTYEITTYALRLAPDDHNASKTLAGRQYVVSDTVAAEFLSNSAEMTGTVWLEPVEYLARLSLAMVDGVVLRWLIDRDSESAHRQLADMVDFMIGKAADKA